MRVFPIYNNLVLKSDVPLIKRENRINRELDTIPVISIKQRRKINGLVVGVLGMGIDIKDIIHLISKEDLEKE
mgnify:CR=1 FL=1